ncbi:hypothetical protein [Streptomyces canus]|uniref:Histidine kinase n=1 Tax=Streptomyces canus TaxID=58343 RepID=A0AAW8FUT7_9ACTN|nr:hypothetical protein [Streptomyces canus]MDQ0913469.1 hypothetical protein [Streptomyces canus]MDQ1073779.1 hypothetical protein [Streptomyces canus]
MRQEVSSADGHPLVLAVRMLLAQAALAFLIIGVLLFAEGLIFFGADTALRHAVERAPFAGVAAALIVTIPRLVKARTGSGLEARSILGIERIDIPIPAASTPQGIEEALMAAPRVDGVTSLGDQRWHVILRAPARWLGTAHVAVTGDRLAVETAPRHPFFFPSWTGRRIAATLAEKLQR